MPIIRRRISPHAAQLRRERTEAEHRFWLAVRNRRLGGYKFRFQHSVFPRVADFACLEARLLVEIDGSQHGDDEDARRTTELERQGFRVLRFWNNDVMQNLDAVLTSVLVACEEARRRVDRPLSRKRERVAEPKARSGEGRCD